MSRKKSPTRAAHRACVALLMSAVLTPALIAPRGLKSTANPSPGAGDDAGTLRGLRQAAEFGDSYPTAFGAPGHRFREGDEPRGRLPFFGEGREAEGESGEAEDEAGLIVERVRWFRERHPEAAPEQKLTQAREEYERRESRKRLFAEGLESAAASWVSIGPTNGAGRISSVAVHPTATGTAYAGSDGGGVWKTTDGGVTWASLTDSINNLNVGAIGVAPSSPNVLYVGTGSEHSSGIGLLKSADGGGTWQFPQSVIASRFFRISVHPTNPLELVAGTSNGAFRSTDGGGSWTSVIPSNPYFYVNDLKRDPSNPSVIYAVARTNAGGRILKSTNGGVSFTEKMTGVASNTDTMSIAVTPASPQVLYVLTSIQSSVSHVYKSTDGGESWTDLPGVFASNDFSTSHVLGSQGGHDNTIVVSPVNPNVVIAGGVRYRRSLDGGQTWSQPFCGANFNCFFVHPDWTDQQYQGSTLWIANDGGVFTSPDDGNTAVERNNGLIVREHYAMFNHPTQPAAALAGSQDNGTDFRPGAGGTSWFSMPYCDTFDTAINSQNPDIAYSTCQLGQITRTKQFGANPNIFSHPPATEVAPQLPAGETWPFAMTLLMDSNNPSVIYTMTTTRVWRTGDGGDSWAPLSTATADGSAWGSPFKLALSKSDPNVLMASSSSNVFRTADGGATWVKRTVPSFVYSLEIDPKDAATAYAGSFNGLYMTADGGAGWVPRNAGLPQTPVLVIRVDPLDSNTLYCGTYNGVYTSSDRGQHWAQLGAGLPSIFVEDLRFTSDGSTLRAATYGRGIWEIQLRQPAPPTPTPTPVNQIDDPSFFARQHYLDFLNREPDASGLAFWTNEITSCGTNAACAEVKRINVSAAFFLSIEFKETGYFVYRTYGAAFGNLPNKPVPLTRATFLPDTQSIGSGVVVGQTGWEQVLENNKQAYALAFVQRTDFLAAHGTQNATTYVNSLFANAGVTPTTAERNAAVGAFGGGGNAGRAAALRSAVESGSVNSKLVNNAFVLMQYFGYLRRDPDSGPDSDFAGYNFWLAKLNQFGGNFVSAEMVKAFLSSTEYRKRFGTP